MTLHEKLVIVDKWLIFRRRLIADAKHMKLTDNGRYEFMSPIDGMDGPSEIFNIRLENLSDEELSSTTQKIKNDFKLLHIQWPMACSDRIHLAVRGMIPTYPLKDFALGIMMLEEMPHDLNEADHFVIKQVVTQDDFALWCDINRFDFGSFHPENHFHLVKEAKLNCFVGFIDGKHAGVAAVVNDEGAAALDFVYVLSDYRQKGLGTALSYRAIRFANELGVKFLVGWAHPKISPGGYPLFKKLRFPAITSE